MDDTGPCRRVLVGALEVLSHLVVGERFVVSRTGRVSRAGRDEDGRARRVTPQGRR